MTIRELKEEAVRAHRQAAICPPSLREYYVDVWLSTCESMLIELFPETYFTPEPSGRGRT